MPKVYGKTRSPYHNRYHFGTFRKCLNRKTDIFEGLEQAIVVLLESVKLEQIQILEKLKGPRKLNYLILTCSG